MKQCCEDKSSGKNSDKSSVPAGLPCCSMNRPRSGAGETRETWFGKMIENCLAYARAQRDQGKPIVGILCEYTPRELILAAGGIPVCLCGGSAKTIPSAEEHLPSNLCPLIKSTYGYHVERSNPFLEMADLVVAGVQSAIVERVVSMIGRKTKPPVFFTGGVALVSGMKERLEVRLGRPVFVAPRPQMTGALGAALLACQEQ